MATAKKYLRTFRRILWYSLAALVVVLAVLVSLFRIFLPDLTAYRSDLEELASTFLDHTVRIESMDARLIGFTPTLIFDDVYMLDKTGERELVRFDQARLGVALIDSIRQRQVVPRNFTIDGIQLAITRQQDGRFLLQGVDVTNLDKTLQSGRPRGSGELADWLFKRSRLSLRNSTIIWKDLKQDGNILRFDDVNLVLRNDNQRHQLNGKV
ncbi:MAG: AsmA family protein, partial [Pseudomonadota bacterium]|nr:AsmA family protein [Pseudomonadota bacterium]